MTRTSPELESLWLQWQGDWRWMQTIAERRGFDVTPLAIAKPAREAALTRLEKKHGIALAPQLRAVLLTCARRVTFGWRIPVHLQASERDNMPYASGIRDAIWDLDAIDEYAMPTFRSLAEDLAHRDRSEERNTPDMWQRQCPFASLPNGDVLTIDTRNASGPQPVRYLSHDLEGLHGLALARDFFTFIGVYAKLGCAGSEWWNWTHFGEEASDAGRPADTYYFSTQTEGARRWLAWLTAAPAAPRADEPPAAIVESSAADRRLLEAAMANDPRGVRAALKSGANIDCTWREDWLHDVTVWPLRSEEAFSTPLNYAARHDNLEMLELLVTHGATVNARRLVMSDAVLRSHLETIGWLIAHGARVDGWKGDRHWPIHHLITHRAQSTPQERDELIAMMKDAGCSEEEAMACAPRPIDDATFEQMLRALLEAGADPDAPWDNGLTMLAWGGEASARILLEHGADVHRRSSEGHLPVHMLRHSAAKAKLLVARGADINAVVEGSGHGLHFTPLQSALSDWELDTESDLVTALMLLGADPHVLDGRGYSSLSYCPHVAALDAMLALGLDPRVVAADGSTLLHQHLRWTTLCAGNAHEAAWLDRVLALGVDINAVDHAGQTALHVAAERLQDVRDVELYLHRGADASIVDQLGKRAVDFVAKSLKKIRKLLDQR